MTKTMEIICVGNELLIGKTLNTNAQWIARQATALGITVKRVTVVADEVEEIATAIQETLKRKPRFAITTGGLGPTFDDKTLQGIAAALDRKLEINTEALEMVRKKYKAYAREKGAAETVELTHSRVKMATLPEKTEPIKTPAIEVLPEEKSKRLKIRKENIINAVILREILDPPVSLRR